MRRIGSVLAWTGVALVAALSLSALAPAALGLSMRTPWAQLVELRGLTGAAALGLGVVLGVLALLLRRRRPRRLAVLAVVLLLAALGHGAVLVQRGALAPPAPVAAADGDLVVAAFNVGPEGTAAADVVDLAVRADADVLVLSETPTALAEQVSTGLADAGRPAQLFGPEPGRAPRAVEGFSLLAFVPQATQLLVADSLGAYEQVPAPDLTGGAVAARPVDGDGPPLVGAHPLPPVPGLFDMDLWRSETAASVATCTATDGAVVAGDLNATTDHAVLQDLAPCADAATLSGATPGTWPTSLPVWLASPIDTVLVDTRRWDVRGTWVERVGGSDHRAVVTVLRDRR